MELNIQQAAAYCGVSAAQDVGLLESDLATACDWVEDVAGPIEGRTVTERAWSTGSYVRLLHGPAVTVVSIDGSTDGGLVGSVLAGWRVVVYTVGGGDVPSWAVSAALARTKHLWQMRKVQGGNSSSPVDFARLADSLVAEHRRGSRP
jgi:hypothetical protein